MANRSQAIEIAVNAHATRLLQEKSPPEACVDSSLGPYVTSILRGALINNITESSISSLPEYESLIELLESQCQMPSEVAQEVIADIALAVKTNEVPNHNNHINNGTHAQCFADKRSRSKSLGAEPTVDYDVSFLGKILQESMSRQASSSLSSSELDFGSKLTSALDQDAAPPQSLANDDFYPVSSSFPSSNYVIANSGSALLPRDRQMRKERHVSFDETYATSQVSSQNNPQCREPYNFNISVSPSSCYTPSSPGDGADEAACLGTSFGFLDMEDEEEVGHNRKQYAMEEILETSVDDASELQGNVTKNNGVSSGVIDSELAKCHPVSGFPDLAPCGNLQEKLVNGTSDKLPINSKRVSKKQSSKREAEDLAAALFFSNSRPRSNSLPLSVHSGASSSTFTDKTFTSSKSSASICTSVTSATTKTTDNDLAVIESTTDLLLTMNYNLGHEAASLSSQLAHGDLNLAQYFIEAARSITTGGNGFGKYRGRKARICRHELQGTCYRADCPYSHDIAGVTCLFWLKGRCHHTDGSSCRFMHGFAESLLEGVNQDYLNEQRAKKEQEMIYQMQQEEEEKRNQAIVVPTANLLERNEWAAEKRRGSVSPVFGNSCWSSPSLMNR